MMAYTLNAKQVPAARFATDEPLPSLGNGRQVIAAQVSESGHAADIVALQPEALKWSLTSFYDAGIADDSVYAYRPVDSHVGLGHPAQAKLGLATIVVKIAGVGALVWFFVRRVRRRRSSQVSS